MTPEQRAREEKLAAFICANGEYLAGVDAVNRANAAHIKIGAANQRKPALRFKSVVEQPAKKDARLQKLTSFTHPTPDQRRGQIRRYLRRTLNRLVDLRDLDHDRYLKAIKAMNKNYFARELRIPKSTFGRLVNSDPGLVTLCNAIMHEHMLLNLINIYLSLALKRKGGPLTLELPCRCCGCLQIVGKAQNEPLQFRAENLREF